MKNKTVSIIIPTYNEEKHLPVCLDSIFNLNYSKEDIEVIVVDNGSSDNTREIAKKYGVRVLRDDSMNVSGLRNLGAKQASGNVLAFVDADCIIAKDWLLNASRYFNDKNIAAWGAPPVLPDSANWLQRTWYIVRRKENSVQDVDWLESMNLFVRKDQFFAVGGFNEKLVTCEDVDFSYRIRKFGKIVCDSRIEVIHLGEASTVKEFIRKEIWRGHSNLQGIGSHGLSIKELPSLLIPLYFGIFLPAILLYTAAVRTPGMLIAALLFLLLPGMAVILKIREKITGLSQIAPLFFLLQIYFFSRTIAVFNLPRRRLSSLRMKTINTMPYIKGILFDVDGTLYHQTPLRVIMILVLITLNMHNPKELLRKIKVIMSFRKAQETLRRYPQKDVDYPSRQIHITSENTGESPAYISETIQEWIENKPLPYLRLCRRKRIKTVIALLHETGLKLGVYSDYPVEKKLDALDISQYISVIVSASDPEVNGFKPQTNGFSVAARRMGLNPSEILYVGDRPDVDGAGASAAGMQVVILNGLLKKKTTREYPSISSHYDLLKIIPSSPR